ncbi:hypothetical protein [Spiroplasma endosymbiont of Amphibalanus improvisus]|uniref:hypothetical protein n=1 Tax=Spiroplasma endosymbiont of Amphibalanus improvisus TaxID=3066327 RepID=UPI00313D1B56
MIGTIFIIGWSLVIISSFIELLVGISIILNDLNLINLNFFDNIVSFFNKHVYSQNFFPVSTNPDYIIAGFLIGISLIAITLSIKNIIGFKKNSQTITTPLTIIFLVAVIGLCFFFGTIGSLIFACLIFISLCLIVTPLLDRESLLRHSELKENKHLLKQEEQKIKKSKFKSEDFEDVNSVVDIKTENSLEKVAKLKDQSTNDNELKIKNFVYSEKNTFDNKDLLNTQELAFALDELNDSLSRKNIKNYKQIQNDINLKTQTIQNANLNFELNKKVEDEQSILFSKNSFSDLNNSKKEEKPKPQEENESESKTIIFSDNLPENYVEDSKKPNNDKTDLTKLKKDLSDEAVEKLNKLLTLSKEYRKNFIKIANNNLIEGNVSKPSKLFKNYISNYNKLVKKINYFITSNEIFKNYKLLDFVSAHEEWNKTNPLSEELIIEKINSVSRKNDEDKKDDDASLEIIRVEKRLDEPILNTPRSLIPEDQAIKSDPLIEETVLDGTVYIEQQEAEENIPELNSLNKSKINKETKEFSSEEIMDNNFKEKNVENIINNINEQTKIDEELISIKSAQKTNINKNTSLTSVAKNIDNNQNASKQELIEKINLLQKSIDEKNVQIKKELNKIKTEFNRKKLNLLKEQEKKQKEIDTMQNPGFDYNNRKTHFSENNNKNNINGNYQHATLHNISKYTRQPVPYDKNCLVCRTKITEKTQEFNLPQ